MCSLIGFKFYFKLCEFNSARVATCILDILVTKK